METDTEQFDEGGALERLLERIPPQWGRTLSCGKGWRPLLARLEVRLAALDADYVVQQVKEKYGELRFYYTPSDDVDDATRDAMSAAVDDAEAEASRTCEETGEPGVMMIAGSWYGTRDPRTADDQWVVATDTSANLEWGLRNAGDDPDRLRELAQRYAAQAAHYAVVLANTHAELGETRANAAAEIDAARAGDAP